MKLGKPIVTMAFALLFVSMSCDALGSQPHADSQRTIEVPDDYPTIQAAIHAAKRGDTILVRAGTYYEHVIIDKSITLIGDEGDSIIDGRGPGHVVSITANNVSLIGFCIRGPGSEPWAGVRVHYSFFNIIGENTITGSYYGVELYDSGYSTLRDNNLTGNHFNFRVWGLVLSHYTHDIDASNTVNGKPVYYWVNQHDRRIPADAGYVAIVNSSSISIKDLNVTGNEQGVVLAYSHNCFLRNVTASNNARGIHVLCSHNNIITGNIISGNEWCGVFLDTSRDNVIIGNTIANNRFNGVLLSFSPVLSSSSNNNTISANVIANNSNGIYLESSPNNIISGNTIANNKQYGVLLRLSAQNTIYGNTITGNDGAVWLYDSNVNTFCHNNFINNTIPVEIYRYPPSINVWNENYPVGGNYWSGFECQDLHGGPGQDETGGDGIGDVAYVIDENNQDRYPLLSPWNLSMHLVADFKYSPSDLVVSKEIHFTDESNDPNGEVVMWFWDFGDDRISCQRNPTHRYTRKGMYAVTLIVLDNEGVMNSTTMFVKVRKMITTLDVNAPSAITQGETFTATATLTDEEGSPIPDVKIDFYLLAQEGWKAIGSDDTDFNGEAAVFYVANATGTFQLQAVFAETQTYGESSDMCTFTVSISYIPYIVFGVVLSVAIISGLVLFLVSRRRERVGVHPKLTDA